MEAHLVQGQQGGAGLSAELGGDQDLIDGPHHTAVLHTRLRWRHFVGRTSLELPMIVI